MGQQAAGGVAFGVVFTAPQPVAHSSPLRFLDKGRSHLLLGEMHTGFAASWGEEGFRAHVLEQLFKALSPLW